MIELAQRPEETGWVVRFRPGDGPDRRLQLETTSASPQRAEDPERQVVFDGYLVDRRDLDGSGTTDAERVLAAWRRGGEEAVDGLRGGFVACLHDRSSGELHAVRDPVGHHPLFYAEAGGTLYLASDVSALVRRPELGAALDPVVVAEYLLDRFDDPEETFWEGIRRVPGGYRLRWAAGRLDVRRTWDPVPREEGDWIEDDVDERFDTTFGRAVARCREIGPAAVFLSGGLDSVSVAGAARDQASRGAGDAPLALSLLFPHPEIDEEATQRRVAARLGLDQVALEFDRAVEPGGGFLASALETCRTWPAPLLNFWLPAYAQLAREGRERGARVVLTGTGGDEWLSVTPYWAADLWRRGNLPALWRLGRSYLRSQRLRPGRVALNLLWLFGWRPMILAGLQRRFPERFAGWRARRLRRRLPSWIVPDPELRRRLDARARRRSASFGPPEAGFYLAEIRRGLRHPLCTLELEETFEAGRRLGMRWMHPYLDPDLVSLLARVPPRRLLEGDWSKALVRSFLHRRFPDLAMERQKKSHVEDFYRERIVHEGAEAVERLGSPDALGRRGIVEPAEASRFLRYAVHDASGRATVRSLHRAWQLLHLETWIRSA